MTQTENAWGAGPGEGYEALSAPFRPIFAEIAASAAERDLNRGLPHEAIRRLKEAGFGAVRLPVEAGGKGASLPQFFNLLIELSAADSNVTQALRGHFGFTEDILNTRDSERRGIWFVRIGGGEIILPGVTIGCNVAVGANSVVAHDLPDDCVAVGSPARVVRELERRSR